MTALMFTLADKKGSLLELGYLYWPWEPIGVNKFGDYWEIVDAEGTSVISLEDIRLSDLYRPHE